ncbi:unnamed protein product, partial [Ceratitis capitata]
VSGYRRAVAVAVLTKTAATTTATTIALINDKQTSKTETGRNFQFNIRQGFASQRQPRLWRAKK